MVSIKNVVASFPLLSPVTITGGSVVKGDAVYKNSTTNQYQIANASAFSTGEVEGLISDASIANGSTGRIVTFGILENAGSGFTVGGKVYLSLNGTSGNTLTQTAPSAANQVLTEIGYAESSTSVFVNPKKPIER